MKKQLISVLLCTISLVAFANDLGKNTYEISCRKCHAPDVSKAIKAPAAFNKNVWDARFKHAQVEAKKDPAKYKSAIDYLLYSVNLGKGLMAHGGLCHEANEKNNPCSDQALIDAIYYMSQRQPSPQHSKASNTVHN